MAVELRNRITRLEVNFDNGSVGEATLSSVDDVYEDDTRRGTIPGLTRRVTIDGSDGSMSMQEVIDLIMTAQ